MTRLWHWGDVVFYFGLLVFAVWKRPHTATLAMAVIVAAVSFPLWILARLQLGSAFAFRARADRLATTGLYSRFRHPVYLFGSLAGVASLVALQVWWVLVVALLLSPITVVRAIREERVLKAAFGEEYDRWRKTTWC